MTVTDIARLTGMTYREATVFVARYARPLGYPPRLARIGERINCYPAGIVDAIRQILGQGHDVADPKSDWLARYIQEGPDGSSGKDRTPNQG